MPKMCQNNTFSGVNLLLKNLIRSLIPDFLGINLGIEKAFFLYNSRRNAIFLFTKKYNNPLYLICCLGFNIKKGYGFSIAFLSVLLGIF